MGTHLSGIASWWLSVVVPARNEEELLPRCLYSILKAAAQVNVPHVVDIVVVSDRSSDGTTAVARRMLQSAGVVMACDRGAVGSARRLGVEAALARCCVPLDRCWIANTDADCVVPEDWLTTQLLLASSGIDAIAGSIDVDQFEDHGPNVAARFRRSYPIAADGSHPHVHGANLGVAGAIYMAAGGWRHLVSAEDHDLWSRLLETGARTKSTNLTQVLTSGRRWGRAPHGFAQALAAHNEDAA